MCAPRHRIQQGYYSQYSMHCRDWGQEIFLCPIEPVLLFSVYWWIFPWCVKLTIPVHLVKVHFIVELVMKDIQGV